MLSIHTLNYQIATYNIRTFRVHERGAPLTPAPDDLPEFLGLKIDSLPLDSLLPVQDLIGDNVILDWTMDVISDVTLEAKELNFQIRQPIAAFYRSDAKVAVDETARRMTAVIDGWNDRIAPHNALLELLYNLERQLVMDRPATAKDYFKVSERSGIKTLRAEMHEEYDKAKTAREKTEALLKSGGAASNPE